MSDYNINKMDFKQLRNEVQLLRDELAIMKRKYEDIIYNLDTDNFSNRFVKEQGDMKTAIEVTAEGIKTKVSKEDLKAYSTIEQTAEQIKSTVTKEFVVEQIEGEIVTNATLESAISQSAKEINLSVSKTYETKANAETEYDNLYDSISSVSINSDRISTRVGNLENGEYGEFTLFEQTPYGFELTGDVSISGDAIIDGTISADRIDTENLSCTRLYAKDNPNGYSARLNGYYGDFGIFSPQASDSDSAGDITCLFGIYNSVPNVNFFVCGDNIFGYDVGTNTVWAKGNWDFTVANVKGL